MMTSISYRIAETTDAEIPSELSTRTFVDAFAYYHTPENLKAHTDSKCSKAYWKEALAREDVFIIIAESEGKTAGYIKAGYMGLEVEDATGSSTEIHRIYIDKTMKNKALGSELMQRALSHNMLKHSKAVYLRVWENNQGAQRFYQRFGFELVGEHFYPVGDVIDRD
jgi:ribosomal protein S18 acetylase RimI-like enzyme